MKTSIPKLIDSTSLKESISKSKEQQKLVFINVIRNAVDGLFSAIPELKVISWTQRTSVYNDETYEFKIDEDFEIQVEGVEPTAKYDPDFVGYIIREGFTMYSKYMKRKLNRDLTSKLEYFRKQLYDIEEELIYAFGSAQITIYKDKPTAEIVEVSDDY